MIPRESDFTRKQEISRTSDGTAKISKSASSINSSNPTSSWSRLKDPRVVRVSRAFGGKDRHSKVCTVRGLRDRRVRLSAPTAIQLYDLQERLGLNQPSKVVDWLLNAAKHEIDELPPLQIPPGTFTSQINNLHQPLLLTSCDHDDELMRDKQGGLNINDDNINWCNDETLKETSNDHHHHREKEEENNWARSNDEVRQFITNSLQETNNNQSSAAAFLSASRQSPYSSSSSLLNNQFVRWDPNPNLTLSHNYPPRSHIDQQTAENLHNFSFVPTMSALPSGSHHQVFLYQPAGLMSTQSYFPFQIPAAVDRSEIDQKHVPYSNPP